MRWQRGDTAFCPPSEAQLKVWMSKYGWTEPEPGKVFICNQEESIKPKNIVEKIDFDSGYRGWGGAHRNHSLLLTPLHPPAPPSSCRCLQHHGLVALNPPTSSLTLRILIVSK